MKDLRIVIVSWNVEKLLGRCLGSLGAACGSLTWDCVVVDNDSRDGSGTLVNAMAASEARLSVIANPDNRGFAKACNQGMVGAEARYVLLLNPDTESPQGSLERLVREADAHPDAGIVGPKLTYPDGRYQESVRRFPGVVDQAGILLKLHHLVPFLPAFKRYFAAGLETEKVQDVDQVMGACFLIRKEVIDQIGGLDERYFIWFEEVDYCRMAKEKGWKVLYAPTMSIIHHGGQSFGQVFSARKQGMFDESLVKYFKKWSPGWRSTVLRVLHPVAMTQSWFLEIRHRPERQWVYWLLGLAALEAVSFATIFHLTIHSVLAVVVAIGVGAVASKRPSLALSILLAELAIGSKGALLRYATSETTGVSLRILAVAAFFFGWLVFVRRMPEGIRGALAGFWTWAKKRPAWIALGLLIVWGVVRGVFNANEALVKDANAWGFLALLVPVIDTARRDGERLMRYAANALIAAFLWLPVKSLLLLYTFSHGLHTSSTVYLWLRRTGVGEATLVTGNLFRLFIQSSVYAVAGLFCMLAATADWVRILRAGAGRYAALTASVVVGASMSLLIGLSRSIWIGVFVGGLVFIGLLAVQAKAWQRSAVEVVGKMAARGVLAVLAALGLLVVVLFFPVPRIPYGSLTTLFASRTTASDAAAQSRWSLLPALIKKIREAPVLGSGFGATVTYITNDPRALAQNPNGYYTTFAFEWGWLEHWVKFGFFGIPVVAWVVWSVLRRVWTAESPWWLRAGMVSSLLALAVLHVFTPYLNHPLGFGFLLVAEGWSEAQRRRG